MTEVRLPQGLDIPRPVAALIARASVVQTSVELTDLRAKVRGGAWAPDDGSLVQADLNDRESLSDAFLFLATGVSTELADRASDLRAIVTAYSQTVAERRPELTQLAKWQRISPSALRHRYNEMHVQAVRELLAKEPLIDIVIEPFVTITEDDLEGVTDELDTQLAIRRRMRQACSDEFIDLFGDGTAVDLAFPAMPTNPRTTRMISTFGQFMSRALERREPELVSLYEDWAKRFAAREVKKVETKPKRVRRPT